MSQHLKTPVGYFIKRNHYHSGNSSRTFRHGYPYMTVSQMYPEPPQGEKMDWNVEPVAYGRAFCSKTTANQKGDTPRRDIGREVSDGRCRADFYKRHQHHE